MQESVYRLIPDAMEYAERPPRYQSKFNANNPPSYSTFPSKVSPLGTDGSASFMFAKPAASIGKEVGHEVNPKKFLKIGDGAPALPQVQKFQRPEMTGVESKSKVPNRKEKPVMNLVTDKNFVMSNAVEAIVTAPKRAPKEETDPRARPSFGKAPKYLAHVKEDMKQEGAMVDMMRQHQADQETEYKKQFVHEMEEEEKKALLGQLRERWEEKHNNYQALPFARDTAMQIARKEKLEKEMKELENAMAKLNKQVIYVYNDAPRMASYTRQEAIKEAQKVAIQRQK